MTETIQPYSWKTSVNVPDNVSRIQKPETEDDTNPMLALSKNLNTLYESINMLNHLVKRYVSESKKFEQILYEIDKKGTV